MVELKTFSNSDQNLEELPTAYIFLSGAVTTTRIWYKPRSFRLRINVYRISLFSYIVKHVQYTVLNY